MKHIQNIIFDVDSTLVTIEGLDFLAKIKNKQHELEPLTRQAMNGELSMREAMRIKLHTLQPSYEDLRKMGDAYLRHIVPGAREIIHELHARGHIVWILTGNFQPAVGMLADYLGVPSKHVITNDICFDERGKFVSINLNHPLCNNHGKAKIIQEYGKKLHNAIMIGDGATDLDTKPMVKRFIGFGGVVYRSSIAQKADAYITTLDLREVLQYI